MAIWHTADITALLRRGRRFPSGQEITSAQCLHSLPCLGPQVQSRLQCSSKRTEIRGHPLLVPPRPRLDNGNDRFDERANKELPTSLQMRREAIQESAARGCPSPQVACLQFCSVDLLTRPVADFTGPPGKTASGPDRRHELHSMPPGFDACSIVQVHRLSPGNC